MFRVYTDKYQSRKIQVSNNYDYKYQSNYDGFRNSVGA